MRKVIWSLVAGSMLLVGLLSATSIRADEWNKKTVVTFTEPVQIPGAVLPAGTYVFKLMDSASDRNIVQIFNADETHLFGPWVNRKLWKPGFIPATTTDKSLSTRNARP
jgi:hypothetical protein